MKLSKDEIIKKLALGIVRNIHIHAKRYQCHFCKMYDREHSSDCPVLLAEEVLKPKEKCSKCGGIGLLIRFWQNPESTYMCPNCEGTGVKK